MKDINRKRVSTDSNVLHQKALSLYGDFSRDSLKQITSSQLLQVKNSYEFRSRFGWKNKKIHWEVEFASEEADDIFPAEMKKLTRIWYCPWFQAHTG